ncbi:MAG: hypothetical protein K9I94_06350 [Bacteroidales bacterium]|nr:hypothetical protein [Bacteroidales bacterium]
MFYLILAILTSTAIIVTFRIFSRFNINILQAITVNYLVASVFGYLSERGEFSMLDIPSKPWFPIALLVGVTLIVAFNLFAHSAQKAGVAITGISSRMSVVIPVILGFTIFYEDINLFKIIGIITALLSFYFIFKRDKTVKVDVRYAWLPFLLFLAVGLNDSMMKYAEYHYIAGDFVLFLATGFGTSLILGSIVLLVRPAAEVGKFQWKNVIGGTILGLLNWWSTLYFLIGLDYFDVSIFVPLLNVSIVSLSTIVGYAAFKEKLRRENFIGVILALAAIVFIALA